MRVSMRRPVVRRNLLLGLLTGSLALVLGAAALSPALAASRAHREIPQCGVRANYFDGYYHNPATHPQTIEGASAYIVNEFGSVCDTDTSAPNPGGRSIGTNFTTAWTMIAAYNYNGWAQTGFIRGYNSPQYEWAEFYNQATGVVYNRFPASPSLPNGVRHAYRELWSDSCACIVMSIDGVEVTQTNFDPYQVWDAGPNGDQFSPQFSGETTYTSSDIPGVPGAQTAFSAMGAQQYFGNALDSMPCTLTYTNSNTARWTHSASSCTAFNIWTSNTG